MSLDPSTRVCPRCGEVAGDTRYCDTCGLNIFDQPALPTRGEWETAHTQTVDTEESTDTGPAHGLGGHTRSRALKWSVATVLIALTSLGALITLLTTISGKNAIEEPDYSRLEQSLDIVWQQKGESLEIMSPGAATTFAAHPFVCEQDGETERGVTCRSTIVNSEGIADDGGPVKIAYQVRLRDGCYVAEGLVTLASSEKVSVCFGKESQLQPPEEAIRYATEINQLCPVAVRNNDLKTCYRQLIDGYNGSGRLVIADVPNDDGTTTSAVVAEPDSQPSDSAPPLKPDPMSERELDCGSITVEGQEVGVIALGYYGATQDQCPDSIAGAEALASGETPQGYDCPSTELRNAECYIGDGGFRTYRP